MMATVWCQSIYNQVLYCMYNIYENSKEYGKEFTNLCTVVNIVGSYNYAVLINILEVHLFDAQYICEELYIFFW